MSDPVFTTGRLARLVSAVKLVKGEVVGTTIKLGFEIEHLDEDAVERLTRMQHSQELRLTIEVAQLGLFEPPPSRGSRTRSRRLDPNRPENGPPPSISA